MVKTKQWRQGGPEDALIAKLIKQGKVNKYTKAADLKKDYPEVLGSFNAQVVRNHLNLNKRVNGLYLDGGSDSDEDVEPQTDDPPVSKKARPSAELTMEYKGADTTHSNYPSIVKQFECPDTGKEKVLAVVTLPGGAKNLTVQLDDDGTFFV